MQKTGGKKKVLIVKGDVVQFVLSPTATFTRGNYFEGTAVALVPKEFSVRIVPSKNSLSKLKPFMDSMGLVTVGFRCARIKSLVAHQKLLQKIALARDLERERRIREGINRLAQQFETVARSGKKRTKKKAKAADRSNWVYRP